MGAIMCAARRDLLSWLGKARRAFLLAVEARQMPVDSTPPRLSTGALAEAKSWFKEVVSAGRELENGRTGNQQC